MGIYESLEAVDGALEHTAQCPPEQGDTCPPLWHFSFNCKIILGLGDTGRQAASASCCPGDVRRHRCEAVADTGVRRLQAHQLKQQEHQGP